MCKKFLALALAILIAACPLALGSCSDKAEFPVTVDGININAEPQNIVVLDKNLADIISCIGYVEKLAGRSDDVNQKGMHVVPSVGKADEADASSIKKLKPDVVFADDELNKKTADALKKSGIPVLIIKKAHIPQELKKVYIKIGKALGGKYSGKSKAKKAYNDLYEDLTNIKDIIGDKKIVKTVCYLYDEDGAVKTLIGGKWEAQVLGFTGAVNVFGSFNKEKIDVKKLAVSNPDFIFCGNKKIIKQLNSNKKLKKLSALKNHTHVIKFDEISMQGETALDALEKMLRHMYPEDFK
jgi:ABC-type Fe3+-hydroxamate transport system substrate-binding protein